MFSAKINLYKPFSRLITKNKLLTLDVIYKAQPFVDVVSSNQNTYNLNTVYKARPFVGTPNNYIRQSAPIGVNHPDVETWLNTLSLSGGTASSSTISALNTFCNSIDSAGLRRKFYRLNLFCGDNLNSCLVPLYVGSWWNEPCIGFSIDQNFNFTSADYNETGANCGLQGNGSNKYLNTGLLSSILPISNRHLYVEERTLPGNYHISIGIRYAGDAIQQSRAFYVYRDPSNRTSFAFAESSNLLVNNHVPCQLFCSNDAAGNGSVYRNGSLAGSGTGYAVSSSYANGTITVFGGRQIYENNVTSITSARLSSYSLGISLNSTEINTFYNIINTFNSSMGR